MKSKWVFSIGLAVCLVLGFVLGQGTSHETLQVAASHKEAFQMAEFSLQALHDEIEADPQGIGYKEANGDWKGDDVIADLINAKNYKIDAVSVAMEAVRAATVYEAYNTLAIDEQEWLTWMTPNSGQFYVTADMKLQLSGRTLTSDGVAGTGDSGDSMWALAHRNTMAPVMLALIELDGGRAEVLWGQGKVVSISEVAHSANL